MKKIIFRIVATFARDSQFRCPICRELINIPRGGVQALPPSFLVNQLLDLMASQRREVIPKCSTHANQVIYEPIVPRTDKLIYLIKKFKHIFVLGSGYDKFLIHFQIASYLPEMAKEFSFFIINIFSSFYYIIATLLFYFLVFIIH